jgi:hypothetical protein
MRKVFGAVFLVLVLAGVACANAELDELRKHMRSNVDEVEGITWIYDKTNRITEVQDKMCHVYIGQEGETIWPRLVLGFLNDEWVFFSKVIFNIDGKREEVDFKFSDIRRVVPGRGRIICEYIDTRGDPYLTLMKEISESEKTLIRFQGRHGKYDFQVSKKQKDAMKRVLRLYELMKRA